MSTEPRAGLGALLAPFALLAALLLLPLSQAPPAEAATGHTTPAPAKAAAAGHAAAVTAPGKASPGEKIARGLRKSPVYVDPAYADALPPGQRGKLAAKIEKSGIPIRIVVVPYISGDAWDGDPGKMADVVRDRLGESKKREAVYMTLSASGGDFLNGYEYPGKRHQAFWGVAAVGHLDDMKDKSLYTRFSRAIEIVEAGNGDKVYEEATKDLGDAPSRGTLGGGLSPLLITALVVAGLAVLLAAALLVRFLRHRSRTSVRVPFTSPRSVFATAREADERDLRVRAQHEVVTLGEELSALESSAAHDQAALQLALDAYAAAGTVLDAADGVPDLAGVLALVHESRQALTRATRATRGAKGNQGGRNRRKARRDAQLPLCFFHPLHGPARERIRWRPLGRRDSLDVAACETCAAAVASHRAPEVLTAAQEGRTVPYFEIPAERSLWAATGYGSLGEGTLTERVARGDFSRAREAQEAAG
ncbi:hypothetical protein [Streptomyces iconiensis]|uniref:TPM domain-containing protein n=1 Tax=Streptomyces iconiensis TaxID=1384038 RepID=A0ABT7A3N5_9ACTN|nr:hypothetical protein [Streptomyces iconiensis]MDJ1135929.1 hypothetical protein [Streptomyces iconiensis]